MLEAQLEEKKELEAKDKASRFDGHWPLKKRLTRESVAIRGRVSKDGVDAIRQLLWAKLGAAEEREDIDPPPGKMILSHTRTNRVLRMVESGDQTHLSIDHYHYGIIQFLVGIPAVGALFALGMFAAGVHHDWIQLFTALYAIAALLLGPLAFAMGRGRQAKSVLMLQEVAELAKQHPVVVGDRVRVAGGREDVDGEVPGLQRARVTDASR